MNAREQRTYMLQSDVYHSSIVRDRHNNPFRIVIRTRHGRTHTIVFGGNLEQARASQERFRKEFYRLRREFKPRVKAQGSDAKFLELD